MGHLTALDNFCMNSDESEIKVCSKCGSPDVECLAYVNVNTGQVISYKPPVGMKEFYYCNSCCDDTVSLITLEEFNEKR